MHGAEIVCGLCHGKGFQDAPSYHRGPCECRKGLARRDAPLHAAHWTTESVYVAEPDVLIGEVEIRVNAEAPHDHRWMPLKRRGNRYMPTLIDLNLSPSFATLTAEQARGLAADLIAAAAAADAVDLPDLDTCGHFAPCPCRHERHDWLDFNRRPNGEPVVTLNLPELGIVVFAHEDFTLGGTLLADPGRPTHEWLP